MSIASIVGRGFGAWESTENDIALRGFSIGAASAVARTLVTRGFLGEISSVVHRGYSAYVNLPEPPVTGKQYEDVSALPALGVISVLQGESPVSVGDVMVDDVVTSRQGYALSLNGDGTFIVDAGGDTTVQFFDADIFHVSGLALDGVYTVFVNDPGPQQVASIPAIYSPIGGFISLDFFLDGYVSDPIGSGLTAVLMSGTLPTGVALTGTLLSGFATSTVNNTLTVQLTDAAGESVSVSVPVFVYALVTIPNVYDFTVSAANSALTALGLVPIFNGSTAYDNTVLVGDVLTQSPIAGSVVNQGSTITLGLSLGPTQSAVPNIVGLTVAQANQTIINAGYVIGSVNQISVPPPYFIGAVYSQSPAFGQTLAPGGAINYTWVYETTIVANPTQILKVTTRQFNLLEMVEREWGASFREPDHRVYSFGGGKRNFDSTDMGSTGIYRPPGSTSN